MKVNEYVSGQFVKSLFSGTEDECNKKKQELEKERKEFLLEYKKICPDKNFMDISYELS